MVDTVYIENSVRNDPQTLSILERIGHSQQVTIERYSEVFNPRAQNFRLQKNNPALILSSKHQNHVLPAPADYNIGGQHNYYFSHMMNCIYDCRYCFLQGMYQSANYVVFTNYQSFFDNIHRITEQHSPEPCWFFSGYDCDSLALEPVTGFMDQCLGFFEKLNAEFSNNAYLEIRTKSTQIRNLLKTQSNPNCIVAYSLSPEPIVSAVEHKTPSLAKRIEALQRLQDHGWPIGLRFDPLIAADNFDELYSELFESVFSALDKDNIHSVSLGTFRLPKPFFKKLYKLYPDEPLLSVDTELRDGMVSYPRVTDEHMMNFCSNEILKHINASQFFPCVTDREELGK